MKESDLLVKVKTHVINGDWNGKVFKSDWLNIIEQAERAEKNAQDLEDMDLQLAREQKESQEYLEAIKKAYENWLVASDQVSGEVIAYNMAQILAKVLEVSK